MAVPPTPTDMSSELAFEARPSHRLPANAVAADGDVWQEGLAVCQTPETVATAASSTRTTTKRSSLRRWTSSKGSSSSSNYKDKSSSSSQRAQPQQPQPLMLRSYYECHRTGQRVWDEPPSGASTIVPATELVKQMAALQLQELQLTTGAVGAMAAGAMADENDSPAGNNNTKTATATTTTKKKKGGLLGALGRNGNTNTPSKSGSGTKVKTSIQYKPGSHLKSQRSSTNNHSLNHANNDPHLQEAIALSLALSSTSVTNKATMEGNVHEDDEDLAMAMALSLSEAQSTITPTMSTTTSATAAAAVGSNSSHNMEQQYRYSSTMGAYNLYRATSNGSSHGSQSRNSGGQRSDQAVTHTPPHVLRVGGATMSQTASARHYAHGGNTAAASARTAAPASPKLDVAPFDPLSQGYVPSPNSWEEQEKRAVAQKEAMEDPTILRKMDPDTMAAASPPSPTTSAIRRTFRRPSSKKKIQDQAGVV